MTDKEKGPTAARAFVFHGPKYFGVGSQDVGVKPSQLIDTCSFTQLISRRLYGDSEEQNPFIMGIAGYGAGKSHLAVALATLFSGHDLDTSREIIANLRAADSEIGQAISESLSKPNLVIALNGMRDFNLNYEVLSAARKSLALHGQDDAPLRALTKAHEVAGHFLERNFHRLQDSFVSAAAERFPNTPPENLLGVLRESLLTTGDAFEVINQVYYQENGSYIHWEHGISAADILTRLNETVCGEHGYFNKILIVFDEFGRFIEYASDFPASAGEPALQQIFEAVQNSHGNIFMLGLIQSDLRSYLARVSRSSNIIRYVSRYEAAEKLYLSSNLETIFANLIQRKDREAFEHFIGSHHTRHQEHLMALHERLLSWLPSASQKSVWREWDRFSKTIVEGTYPLHPITTWILTTLSEWLQQRSALTFVHDALNQCSDVHVEQFGDLPYIHSTQIIRSDFFRELLAAEEEGRQQTDVCRQYANILAKHEHRLDENEKAVLAANVIARIGRFLRTKSREEAELLLAAASGLSIDEVSSTLQFLEVELGVLSFDPHSSTFDFLEDAYGAADFRRAMDRKRRSTKINLSLIFDGEIRHTLGLDEPQDSAFGTKHNIKTNEWGFFQEIVWCDELTDDRLQMYVREWKAATAPEKPKGRVLWVYVPPDSPSRVYDDLITRIARNGLFNIPTVFMLLDDRSGQLHDALVNWQVAHSLTEEERIKFERFIPGHLVKTETAVRDAFERLQQERLQISPEGAVNAKGTIAEIVTDTFARIYPQPIPFMFEGFRAKHLTPARKNLGYIARSLCSDLVNYQWFHAQNSQIRNRIAAVLMGERRGSWGILDAQCNLVSPSDPTVLAIFSELDDRLDAGENRSVDLGEIFDRLVAPPYGANNYSAALLLAVYVYSRKNTLRLTVNGERYRLSRWAEYAFPDRGVDLKIIKATSVHRVDLEGARNEFVAICNAIETNTSLNKWGELLERLETLTKHEAPPEDLVDKVDFCRLVAERGREVWSKYQQFVREQLMHLNQAKENGDVPRVLEVILRCEKHLTDGEALERYRYGASERRTLQQLIDAADVVVHDNFDRWMSSLRCESYAQFAGFSKFIQNQVHALRDIGYDNYARRLQAHLERIADDMQEIKIIQTVRETTDRFIQICKPTRYTSYVQLAAWEQEGEQLIHYIRKALPSVTARRLADEVSARLREVRQHLQHYRDEIAAMIDAALELNELRDCYTLLDRIRSLLDRSIRPQDAEDIREIADALANLVRDFEAIDQVKHDPDLTARYIETLRDKWERAEVISAIPVLDNVLGELEREWRTLESEWIQQHLSMPLGEIAQWSAEQCTRWLEVAETSPAYLSADSKERLGEVANAVKKRLDEIPILAAVAAYNRLNKEQKRQFLVIILSDSSDVDPRETSDTSVTYGTQTSGPSNQ